MKQLRYRKILNCAGALIATAFFALGTAPAHAQSALNISHLIPQRSFDAALPETEVAGQDEEGNPILVRPTVAQQVFPEMSEAEAQAFLARPRSWFHSVGTGGSPYTKPVALDDFAKILTPEDEKLYRQIFTLITQGKLQEASTASLLVKDKVLMGHVQAGLLIANKNTRYVDLQDWLQKYNDLPEATDIYEKALRFTTPGVTSNLTKPASFTRFGGNAERADGGGSIQWDEDSLINSLPQPQRSELSKLLKKNKEEDAIRWLVTNNLSGRLSETSYVAGSYALAETLMRRGQSAQAWAVIKPIDPSKGMLSGEAYAYALWVKGLIAWIQKEYLLSYATFASLADRQGLPNPNQAAASFWAARAAERVGRKPDATRFMTAAAKLNRSFYGVLALSHNNTTPEYNWTMPNFKAEQAEALKKTAAGKRALALLQFDARALAEAELRSIPLSGNSDLSNSVLALANRYGLPSLAMQIGGAFSRGHTYDAALYPLIPWQPAGGYASDPALVLAVAKNESNFNHIALSHAGAKGIMQVMPKTAELVKPGTSNSLYDPETNVTLGDRYLDMLTRTDGVKDNLLMVIGSYNCGPDALVRLRDASVKQNGDDALIFIETLPIKETRDYMQKVMATYWVYRARFNKPLKSMAELSIGRWPHYQPNDMKLSASRDTPIN